MYICTCFHCNINLQDLHSTNSTMRGDFEEKPQYIAALDIGTTTIRCIIFNHLCQIIGSSYTNVGKEL